MPVPPERWTTNVASSVKPSEVVSSIAVSQTSGSGASVIVQDAVSVFVALAPVIWSSNVSFGS